jgi:hypothetical protein
MLSPYENLGRLAVNRDYSDFLKSVLQVLAILCLIALLSVVALKAFADITPLAQRHSGVDFWVALARHLLRNLAGG